MDNERENAFGQPSGQTPVDSDVTHTPQSPPVHPQPVPPFQQQSPPPQPYPYPPPYPPQVPGQPHPAYMHQQGYAPGQEPIYYPSKRKETDMVTEAVLGPFLGKLVGDAIAPAPQLAPPPQGRTNPRKRSLVERQQVLAGGVEATAHGEISKYKFLAMAGLIIILFPIGIVTHFMSAAERDQRRKQDEEIARQMESTKNARIQAERMQILSREDLNVEAMQNGVDLRKAEIWGKQDGRRTYDLTYDLDTFDGPVIFSRLYLSSISGLVGSQRTVEVRRLEALAKKRGAELLTVPLPFEWEGTGRMYRFIRGQDVIGTAFVVTRDDAVVSTCVLGFGQTAETLAPIFKSTLDRVVSFEFLSPDDFSFELGD
ncbi:MAG: hypothetical protein IT462_15610 [Planctomycetes bacterium]|nr:hypothetical protein [Planctomycetota bacterium]